MRSCLGIVLCLLFLYGCESPKDEITLSFYHWKQRADLDSLGLARFNQLHSEDIYYRIFDISMEGNQILPVSNCQIDTSITANKNIYACVFISNRVIISLKSQREIQELASKIIQKFNRDFITLYPSISWKGLQIDCDWDTQSKEGYFDLLENLRFSLKPTLELSSTLRLHQYKYPNKTGVPPVERVALMCYNMGDIKKESESNSIFQPQILESYIRNVPSYPLPLDLALPLFEWNLIYRDAELYKIINHLSLDEKWDQLGPNKYRLKEDSYQGGHYLYKGDILRVEHIDEDQLIQGVKKIQNHLESPPQKLIFYPLDQRSLERYEASFLRKILQMINT